MPLSNRQRTLQPLAAFWGRRGKGSDRNGPDQVDAPGCSSSSSVWPGVVYIIVVEQVGDLHRQLHVVALTRYDGGGRRAVPLRTPLAWTAASFDSSRTDDSCQLWWVWRRPDNEFLSDVAINIKEWTSTFQSLNVLSHCVILADYSNFTVSLIFNCC